MKILHALLVHQANPQVQAVLTFWKSVLPQADVLLLHGGTKPDFAAIDFTPKAWVDDVRLRTVRHPPEKQSYRGLFAPVTAHLSQGSWSHVSLWEGDHLPLARDFEERLLTWSMRQKADVLGYSLRRIDRTNDAHLLFHRRDPEFEKYFRGISVRKDPSVILSFLGTGTLWTREAWLAMNHAPPGPRIYLEIDLPSTIHHLGFRVAGMGEQDRFVQSEAASLPQDQSGAWSLHPVKAETRQPLLTAHSLG